MIPVDPREGQKTNDDGLSRSDQSGRSTADLRAGDRGNSEINAKLREGVVPDGPPHTWRSGGNSELLTVNPQSLSVPNLQRRYRLDYFNAKQLHDDLHAMSSVNVSAPIRSESDRVDVTLPVGEKPAPLVPSGPMRHWNYSGLPPVERYNEAVDRANELLADHSTALQFVREIAQSQWAHAAPGCACIVCRARTWLHTEQPQRPIGQADEILDAVMRYGNAREERDMKAAADIFVSEIRELVIGYHADHSVSEASPSTQSEALKETNTLDRSPETRVPQDEQ